MGSSQLAIQHLPCANCGRRPGVMGSSAWAQPLGAMVCSAACGRRLDRKVRGGMVTLEESDWQAERVRLLRLRVKVLEGKLRAAERIEVAPFVLLEAGRQKGSADD